MKTLIVFLILFLLTSCDYLDDMARANWEKKQAKSHMNFEDVENWKQTLALNESELRNLDKSIHDMVSSTAKAGALSWKIAQAYMKASNYEMGLRFYQRSLDEAVAGKSGLSQEAKNQGRVAYWESALPYFNKSLIYRDVDMQLLFEMGLAYANASKDMGWEPERRSRAVEIFLALIRYDPKDSRFPYQLALIYFDSSVSTGTWAIQEGYRDIDKAFSLIDAILLVEPENVATRFAKANFLHQLGKTNQSYSEYQSIKAIIEDLDRRGEIRGDLRNNTSYQNVIQNIEKIQSSNLTK